MAPPAECRTPLLESWRGQARRSWSPSDGLEHRIAAMLAEEVLGRAHSDDRLVCPTVGALRGELVAPQAVDASIPAGELGRPRPGLAAARTGRTLKRRLFLGGGSQGDAIVAS